MRWHWPWRFTITGDLKSQEEGFYLRLHAQLIRCDPLKTSSLERKSLNKDLDVLKRRTLCEGLAFLTKSLPSLGKAFDRALVSGKLNIPLGFKPSHGNANIPAFLQAYFSLVFDEDGLLRDVAPVDAIKHIRQVLYFAYKLELPYTALDESRVIENFVKTDLELELMDSPLANDIYSLAKIITWKVFHEFNHKDIQPRHGPGAVATGEKLDTKWKFSRKYNAIHQVYPYYDYYVVGGARELTDRLDWYRSLARLESGVAKVVLVPKDSRGPRLISCEPLEYQWIQQGLGRKLANHLEWISPYTKGNINFERQEINGNLAKTSSASQRYVTLDLKDASDRVSLELVRRVFERTPQLLRALEACRSTETKLPDGRIISLKKFAPMGSALCFPVEAYVFWAIIVSAVIRGKNMPLDVVGKRVFVYGDDIVIPTEWTQLSIQALETVGLKVNIDKSCTAGFFRESCGVDAYKGEIITPIRLKKRWSGRNHDGSTLQAYSVLANSLAGSLPAVGAMDQKDPWPHEQGVYRSVSDLIWFELERVYGKTPYGTFRASYPCKVVKSALSAVSLNKKLFKFRFNRRIQQIEFLLPSLSLRRRRTTLDSWPRLLRDVITPPFGDPSYIVLPLSMKIRRGWTSIT